MDFVLGVVLLFASGVGFGLLAAHQYITSLGWEDAE